MSNKTIELGLKKKRSQFYSCNQKRGIGLNQHTTWEHIQICRESLSSCLNTNAIRAAGRFCQNLNCFTLFINVSNFSGSDTSISKKNQDEQTKLKKNFLLGKKNPTIRLGLLCSLEFHLVTNQNKRILELNKYLIEKSKKVL